MPSYLILMVMYFQDELECLKLGISIGTLPPLAMCNMVLLRPLGKKSKFWNWKIHLAGSMAILGQLVANKSCRYQPNAPSNYPFGVVRPNGFALRRSVLEIMPIKIIAKFGKNGKNWFLMVAAPTMSESSACPFICTKAGLCGFKTGGMAVSQSSTAKFCHFCARFSKDFWVFQKNLVNGGRSHRSPLPPCRVTITSS